MKLFPEKLRTARENAGLTQKELGRQCGISPRSVYAYENGRFLPRSAVLHRLAAALAVSPFYLIEDREEIILPK